MHEPHHWIIIHHPSHSLSITILLCLHVLNRILPPLRIPCIQFSGACHLWRFQLLYRLCFTCFHFPYLLKFFQPLPTYKICITRQSLAPTFNILIVDNQNLLNLLRDKTSAAFRHRRTRLAPRAPKTWGVPPPKLKKNCIKYFIIFYNKIFLFLKYDLKKVEIVRISYM